MGIIRGATVGGEPRQLRANLSFDGQKPVPTSMLAFTVKKHKHRTDWINLPVAQFAPASIARVVTVQAESELSESFSISAIRPLMKVIDECVADLRRV